MVTAAEIDAVENEIGLPLAKAFKDFVSINDGAKIETDALVSKDGHDLASVRGFLRADQIPLKKQQMESEINSIYPIAYDGGGNYIVIDAKNKDAISFWDHEMDELTPLASSFSNFLEMLEPLDPSTIKLDPKDVISVWVHPDLQKYIKR